MESKSAADSERISRALRGVTAVAGFALLGGLVFMTMVRTSLSGLEVITDGQPWQCEDATVDLHPQDGDFFILVVDAVPDMNCKLRFFVR
ncbi:MAG: hypothetical protein HKN03_13120, partial [Acidimicrobiales bacterium]|nr:hypothetical protein [Acidimicrobiales bacterium]